jgi:hypothetical protein
MSGMLAMFDLIYLLKYTKEAIDWEAICAWLDRPIAATHLYLMLTYLARSCLIDIPLRGSTNSPYGNDRSAP